MYNNFAEDWYITLSKEEKEEYLVLSKNLKKA